MISLELGPRAQVGLSKTFHTFLSVAVVAIIAGAAPSAQAANRFWITNAGGAFGAAANWSTTSGGAGGASVPGASDVANLSINQTYTINFAANATNVGLLANIGTVTLDLNSNTYTITGATGTSIGTTNAVTGRLVLTDGTLAVDTATDRIQIGATGSTGFLTVSSGGRLGNGTIDPTMIVGDGGTGTLTVEDNGRADLGSLSLGQLAGSSGTISVNGPNAVLDASDGLTVGLVGNGAFNVQNSGLASVAGGVAVGGQLGANGSVTISNAGTKWNHSQWLILGNAGDASLIVQSGATMNSTGVVLIGNLATGIGTAQVTGSESVWNMSNTLQVGGSGLGGLIVSAGGRANTTGATLLADLAGGRGNVVVSGAGSKWNSSSITVGNSGEGSVTISAGGVVDTTGNVSLGGAAAGTGKVIVSGENSAWNITGALNIAAAGSGNVTVGDGALLSTTGALSLGDPAGAPVGTLNLNGGVISAGSFTRSGSSQFNWTNGTFIVNGGAFNNSGVGLTINGSDLDDVPALRLASGAQITAASVPNITIGSNRQGAVVLSGGSKFQTTTASIGSQDTGTGSLVVEGTNSEFSATGDLGVGGTSATAGGLGTITLGPNGKVISGGTLRLWDGGTVNISGGTLRFNALAANGGKAVFNSGTIQVTSAFNANGVTLDALLGSNRVLGVGRTVDSQGNAFNLQANLTTAGGAIAGNTLAVSANVVASFESDATATFTAGITNPAAARVFVINSTVAAGTTFTNGGELHLAGSTATVNATNVNNTGLVSGSGRLNSVVTNNAAGQVRVAAGQRLEVLGAAGTNVNNGLIDVDGGAIEFGRSVTNSSASPSTGLIAARNATLRFNGNLANSGSMTFTEGVSDVFGDITNQNNFATPGRIVVTGGAQANFFDDVVNNGVIQVSATGGLESTAVFLGSLSGAGVSGTGHVFLEGDTRPGFSPGTMAFGGDVSFGPFSSLDIEIGGLAAGTQFDRVTVADTASIDGALEVSFLNNFKPAIGNSFQILAAAGGLTGTFAQLALPALAGGASWSVDYSTQAVTLSVGGVLGDFNHDGTVNSADYTVWRDQVGTNSIAADASGNGTVGPEDYNIWKANFGETAESAGSGGSTPAAAAVPEPATLALLIGLIGLLSGCRRRPVAC